MCIRDSYLQNTANVAITVLNSSNHVVKTIQASTSEGPCYPCYVSWDGTNDQNQVMAPGQYTIQILATNNAGSGTIDTLRDVANPGSPGSLTSPTNGATLSGTAGFVFTPSAKFPSTYAIQQVYVSCIGSASTPSSGGTWQGSGDTGQCQNGSQQLTDSVYFTDPLGTAQSWTDPNPPTVTIGNPPGVGWYSSSQEQYLFPGVAGMGNQTTYADYYLQNTANVAITVLNSSNHVVKTIQASTSEGPCYPCYVSWDGTNDQNQVMAPGQYTIQILATNNAGSGTIDTLRDVANPGSPGSLTSPTNGATLSGTAGFVFTPSAKFPSTYAIQQVYVSCIGSASTPSSGGTWQGSGDTGQCQNGSQQLTDSVYFTDPLGTAQSWTDPNPPTVTIGNPPGVGWYSSSQEQYLFPGVAGMGNQTTYADYYLQNTANVAITVLNSSNHVVKTIQASTSEGPCYPCYVSWDGTNDQNQVMAPGQYTIQILATNNAGSGTIDTLRDVANPGSPGSLTSPTNGATLSGTAGFVFTPSAKFPSTYAIQQVYVSCIGSASTPSSGGTWQGSGDTGQCQNGSQQLTDSVYFTDPLGTAQSWTDPNPPTVTIGNPPGVGWYSSSQEQYLFPGVAGMGNQTTYADYYLQNTANVAITVLNSSNHVVKTIQASTSEGPCYPCYVSWDGTNDQNQVMAPGQYTIQILATNNAGSGTIDTLRDVANPGSPGSLTSPTNGATLSGTAGFVFTPSAKFPSTYAIQQVYVSCIGSASTPSSGGTWQGSGDTGQCQNGSQQLTDSVYFTDPLGTAQSWTDPNPPTVTIGNPPGVGWYSSSQEQYLFPGVAGMGNQTTYADYYLQNTANVAITVLNSSNHVVKTIQASTSEGPCYPCYVSWDGTNDQNQVMAPGQYTIQILATNNAGSGTIDTLRDVANPGSPGSLTSPTNGATLSGTAGFVFTPSAKFPSTYAIQQVYVSCIGSASTPSSGGTWQGSGDTGQCQNGSQQLTDSVYFTDPLGTAQSWTDPNPPTVTIGNPPGVGWYSSSQEQYLFPGVAGMGNQTTYADYYLQNTANVAITVLNSSNHVVKTIQASTSEGPCYPCYVSWDGTNDQNQVMAPGQYTIQILATNNAGSGTIDTLRDVANPGSPGSLTSPTNGATLSGTAGFVFTPSAKFPSTYAIQQVYVSCIGSASTPSSGGTWQGSGDTGQCQNGSQQLTDSVYFTDPLGTAQSWTDPNPPTVTIGNPPGVGWYSSSQEQYLFPGVAGMGNQTTYADYYLQNTANVAITVLNSSNHVVKTIQASTSEGPCYPCYVSWDGTNDQNQVMAPGQYTIQILATNNAGSGTIDTLRDVANPGSPGSLTSPTNGATLSGTAGFVFTPSAKFPSTYAIQQVYVSCIGSASTPSSGGTWQGSGDTGQCQNGSQQLTDSVYFTDPLGTAQSWTDPNPPTVTIGNPPGVGWYSSSQEQYLFPGVAGMGNQTTYADYYLQNTANVAITVLNSSNHVVKTIQASTSEGPCYPCYVSWDGTNDQNQVMAPGQYTIQILATNNAGSGTIDTLRDVANPGSPGSLTSPTNGATLSGTAGFVFTPSAKFPSTYAIQQVYVSCIGSASTPSSGGTWQGSGDTGQCQNGSQQLTDSVYFTDPLGTAQSWTDPNPPTVTIGNPPGVGWYSSSQEQYLFPGVAGMGNQTTYADYYLQNTANVAITVLNSSNHVVKTIQASTSEGPCYPCYVSWDGTNDQNQVMAPGQYTIQILATNNAGSGTIDTLRDVANPGSPGSLTSPTNGATLSGTAGFVFTPSAKFPSTYAIQQVYVSCIGSASTPSSGGTWQGSGDTGQCQNGSQQLTDSVYFTDPLGTAQSWTDPNPPTVTIGNPPGVGWYSSSQEQYLFPGVAGMGNQTTYADYYLQNTANVAITVLNSSNHVVKTIQASTSEGPCYPCYVSWDGTNDQNQVMAPGQYTIQILATNNAGSGTIDTLRDVANPGSPGSLTSPTNGATLSGTAGFVFTPSAKFPSTYAIQQVYVSCIGSASTPSSGGTWQGSGDTGQCQNGSQQLTDSVYFTDPLGTAQSWTDPNPPTVTIGNPPGVGWYSSSQEQYLFPGVAGMGNQTTYADYYLQNTANVAITVLNSSNHVVKTIQASTSEGPCYPCYVSWDGTNDQNQVMAPGQYTIQILATNNAGSGTIDTLRDVANPGSPGSLTSPTNGATLSGTAGFVFTPSAKFPSTYAIQQVYVSCIGSASTPSSGGTWQGSGDTGQCQNGSQQLTDSVYFTDPLGTAQSWTDPNPPTVTIGNPPGVGWYSSSQEQYLFPGVAGMGNQTTYADYYLQNTANVAITVLNSSNHVVKTIQASTSEGPCYPCYVSWDGTNDQNQVMAPGQYTIQIVATNNAGSGTIDTLRDVANPGSPGSLTSPVVDGTLSGLAHHSFTPSADLMTGWEITQVDFCLSTGGCVSAYNPSTDGTWQTTELTGGLTAGPATLTTTTYLTDPLGNSESWTDGGTPVSVNTTALVLQASFDNAKGLAPLSNKLTINASDPNGTPLTYTVNFGDGTQPTTGTIAYPYNPVALPHSFVSPGVDTVNVTVSDGASGFAQTDLNVTVLNASLPIQLSPSPSTGPAPLATTFTLSTSDASGQPVNYDIAFGDGQATAGTITSPYQPLTVTHTYTTPGNYQAGATVSDSSGTTGSTVAVVTATGAASVVPSAGESQTAVAGTPVTLDGSGSQPSGSISGYQWNFGDGSTGSGAVVSHSYVSSGN